MGAKNKLLQVSQLLNNFKDFLESETPFVEHPKSFGSQAERVTTDEMHNVFKLIKEKLCNSFSAIELVESIKSKQTHGDIDILLVNDTNDIKNVLYSVFGEDILDFRRENNLSSILLNIKEISKVVHVDFIVSRTLDSLNTKKYYYSLNDFSAIIGIISKRLNFKYGSDGFYKIFKDIKGNYHNIFITSDLILGLKFMGFDISLYSSIKDHDDIINFVCSSKLVDSSFLNKIILRDKQAVGKRPGLNYIFNKLCKLKIVSSIKDEDYYFKSLAPDIYSSVISKMEDINNRTYLKSKYSGQWVIDNFNINPGPQVGIILKFITDSFKNNLDAIPEQQVIKLVKERFFNV